MNVLFGRGAETTFSQDLTDYDALALELQPLLDKVWRHFETMGAGSDGDAQGEVFRF